MSNSMFIISRIRFGAFIIFMIMSYATISQNVSINNDGSLPDNSAILDIKSTYSGLLIPRMMTSDRTSIGSPAIGLIVFDIDTNSFWFWAGPSWIEILDGFTTVLRDTDGNTKIQVEENANDDLIRFDMAGVEYFKMNKGKLELLNTGKTVIIGEDAGFNLNYAGNSGSVYIGYNAGKTITDNSISNTGIGHQALMDNTGFNNTGIGYDALSNNSFGQDNTAT